MVAYKASVQSPGMRYFAIQKIGSLSMTIGVDTTTVTVTVKVTMTMMVRMTEIVMMTMYHQHIIAAAVVQQVQRTCQDMQHLQQQLLAVRWGVLHQIHQSWGVGPYASCQACKLASHLFCHPYPASIFDVC